MARVCGEGTVRGFFLEQRVRYERRRPSKTEGSIELPPHLRRHYHVWRLVVLNKVVRLEELRKFWDLNEVMRANELLDIQEDAEWLASLKK